MTENVPQLGMRRPTLANLPPVALPEGFALRAYEAGDEAGWNEVVADSFESDSFDFDRIVRIMPSFLPARTLFVVRQDRMVATASIFLEQELTCDKDAAAPAARGGVGFVHMVGVRRSEQGKRLGYWVTLAALHRMNEEGMSEARLGTDDHRLSAMKTYLRLGFEPQICHESHPERWRTILKTLTNRQSDS